MKKFDLDSILQEFVSGDINLEDLSEVIDERLFELRQKPEVSPEQERLSSLELYIHEISEGYRNLDELYEHAFSEVENKLSERFIKTITLNSSTNSEFQITTRAIPVKDYRLSSV